MFMIRLLHDPCQNDDDASDPGTMMASKCWCLWECNCNTNEHNRLVCSNWPRMLNYHLVDYDDDYDDLASMNASMNVTPCCSCSIIKVFVLRKKEEEGEKHFSLASIHIACGIQQANENKTKTSWFPFHSNRFLFMFSNTFPPPFHSFIHPFNHRYLKWILESRQCKHTQEIQFNDQNNLSIDHESLLNAIP